MTTFTWYDTAKPHGTRREIFRGETDVPLNEMGLKEASLAAEFFRGREVQAVLLQPSVTGMADSRARSRRWFGARLFPSTGINDMSFGAWEGQPLPGRSKE